MNKQQLIEAIANEVDVTKATAASCLDAFINTVTKVLKKKGEVRLVGFGTFTSAKRKATTGRNPQVLLLKSQLLFNQNSNLVKL